MPYESTGGENGSVSAFRIVGLSIRGITILLALVLCSCAPREDKVGMLLDRLETSGSEGERAEIVGTEPWNESDPRIEEAYEGRLSRDTTREDLYVAWYLAKRGNPIALRILNDNYYEYPVSSWDWSYVVRVFGQHKYAPAVPNLIWSLRSASLNLADESYKALRAFYPDAPGDLPSQEAAYQYFKKCLEAEQGPLGEAQFVERREYACMIDPNDLPLPLRCGRWVARLQRPEEGVLHLMLGEVDADGVPVRSQDRFIRDFPRCVSYFWIPSADGPRLAINDFMLSNLGEAMVYDPQTGKTLQLGRRIWQELGQGWADMDHIYSQTVAFSPDGAKLIVHLWGHDDSSEVDRYVVADARSGGILRKIADPDLIGSKWWQ